jgi:signal transduction histidine kinase
LFQFFEQGHRSLEIPEDSFMTDEVDALRRRISWLEDEREQLLIVGETSRDEIKRLVEERDRLQWQKKEQTVELARVMARNATLEAQAVSIRHKPGGELLRPAEFDYTVIAEELQTTIEELQVTTEELEIANDALRLQNESLEQRVEERTAALKDAIQELARSQDLLRYAQRCAGAGTWDWDVESNAAVCSPEYFELFGLDPGNGIQSAEAWLASLHPEDRARTRAAWNECVFNPGKNELVVEFRVDHPRFGERWIMVRGRVVDRQGERATRMIGLSIDISRQKHLEYALREAAMVAEAASQAKTRFIAAASHDLRQPIQAASLYLGLLRRHRHDDATRELLDLVQASFNGLHGMLNGLLDLSRLEAGVIEPKIGVIHVEELLARLSMEFRAQAEAKGIELRVRGCRMLLRSDAHLLERILRNLLANAVTHTAEGRILLACRRRGNHAKLQIWDMGPGIPENDRHAIFEEFQQLRNPERNAARGFGLGLAIVKRMAQLLGHEISLRSVVDHGSVFSVLVPLADEVREVMPETFAFRRVASRRLRGRTVLLVEDNRAVRQAIVMLLEAWGMTVVSSRNRDELAELMEHMEGERPSALISDYRLPGGQTGKAVVDMVRSRWDLPAIIITGDTAPERLREASSIGCHLLHKPVVPEELASILNVVMPS